MLTREYCIEYVSKFLLKLKIKGIKIRTAKIFGSVSQDSINDNSDIDLLLVSENFSGANFIDYQLFSKELVEFDKLHIKTYSCKDYDEGDPFIEEIENKSIIVNC